MSTPKYEAPPPTERVDLMRSLTVRVALGSLTGPAADLVRLTATLYEAREAAVPQIAEELWGAARAASGQDLSGPA